MSKLATRLHALRISARQLADAQSFSVQADAFADDSHFDGPRYYCQFLVPALGPDWQDAGDAESTDGALENLIVALLMAHIRLNRLESEFLPSGGASNQNFSDKSSGSTAAQVISDYRRADTAAQVVYARQTAYGCPVAQAHIVAGCAFRYRFSNPNA